MDGRKHCTNTIKYTFEMFLCWLVDDFWLLLDDDNVSIAARAHSRVPSSSFVAGAALFKFRNLKFTNSIHLNKCLPMTISTTRDWIAALLLGVCQRQNILHTDCCCLMLFFHLSEKIPPSLIISLIIRKPWFLQDCRPNCWIKTVRPSL